MSHVHSLLAIYGALDRLVLEQPELEAIVERYLPGTTGGTPAGPTKSADFLNIPGEPLPEFPSVEDGPRHLRRRNERQLHRESAHSIRTIKADIRNRCSEPRSGQWRRYRQRRIAQADSPRRPPESQKRR